MEKKTKNIVIGITSLLLTTLLLLGLTYAYYKTRIVGNSNEKSVSVTSKNLSVTYQNESAEISAEGIEPGYSATKTFEVKNTGSETVEYSVMLDNVTNTFARTEDWTYTISEGGTTLKSGTLPYSTSYILYSEGIDAGATKIYTLKIDYANSAEDQSEDMGKSLTFRINIDNATASTLTSADKGTLLYAIGRDNVISEPLSVPGQQASLENEAVLASTEDDDGTSYYFRGNVINNYVNYSGMCWRIVRVQGDGNIKLIIADLNNTCEKSSNKEENVFLAFEKYYNSSHNFWDCSYFSYFSEVSNSISDYDYNKSVAAKVLNAWAGISDDRSFEYFNGNVKAKSTFTNEILDTSKIINAEWCVDTTVVSDGVFGAGGRLRDVSNATPTLKCDMVGINDSTTNKYTNKLGILSADEVVFAGITSDQVTTSFSYLKVEYDEDISGYKRMFTLTPSDFETYSQHYSVCSLEPNQNLNTSLDYNAGQIRPSIVLASNVTISATAEQDGTQTNPYVIS